MTQDFSGWIPFLTDLASDTGHTLLIAVRCNVGDSNVKVDALLDCAAEWSVLNRDVAQSLGLFGVSGDLELSYSTRFGLIHGHLDGESLSILVRWFVSEHWYGPTVIGWRGGLNLMRFSVNPDEDRLYFAATEGRAA